MYATGKNLVLVFIWTLTMRSDENYFSYDVDNDNEVKVFFRLYFFFADDRLVTVAVENEDTLLLENCIK